MTVEIVTVKTICLRDENGWYGQRARFQNLVALSAHAKLQNWIYIELYLRMNLRRCLHVEISSLRLFNVAMCGLVIRKNFSVLQRLQRFR